MTKKKSLYLQYGASLTMMFGIALAYIIFPEYIFTVGWLAITLFFLFVTLIFVSRRLARRASREASIDSVLIFRYFFLGFWIAWLILPHIALTSELTAGDSAVSFILLLIVIANVIGIRIHLKKRKKFVKNVKKEELFQ